MKKLRGRKYEKIENIVKPDQIITSKYLFVMTSILRFRFFWQKVTFKQKPVVSTGHYYLFFLPSFDCTVYAIITMTMYIKFRLTY